MTKLYFNPGCALSIYKPDIEQRVLDYLNNNYGETELHKICCHHNPNVEDGSTVITMCSGCDRRFRSAYDGINTISLWEVLNQIDSFPYPDYHGIQMSVQDACPVRDKPQVHQAVRALLHKMNIEVVETENHGTRSVCCGDSFYPALTKEQTNEMMKKRADEMPCGNVVVYCVSCIKSMYIGGKKPRHLADLLFSEDTTPDVYETDEWHKQLQDYIDEH